MARRREPGVGADRRIAEISTMYEDAQARLERLLAEALERGIEGTSRYRTAQLEALRRVLSDLQDAAVPAAAEAVAAAYSTGAVAAERAMARRSAIAFGGVHQDAVEVLADALAGRLNEVASHVALSADRAIRRAALQEAAVGIAAGDARRDVSAALKDRIVREGLVDGMAAHVDAGGRRMRLAPYAKMVARTDIRAAVTAGTTNRLLERGDDLVTISSHLTSCDICGAYDGKTFSLSGAGAHPALDRFPPFHPNCRHVLTPAAGSLDAFEAGLLSDAA